MMKAIMVGELGGPEVLRLGETEIPEPGPEEALIRVLAAGVGPWDASLRSGSMPGPQLPYIPGAEFAGLIVGDTGADAAFEDGEPVYGYPALTGCYAEYVTCPIEQLAPVPAGLDVTEAAAVPVGAIAADQGLTDVLDLGSGDVVLITAVAGGVGHFAVQIARALGAQVIGTASPQHHEFAHKLGASWSWTIPSPTGPTRSGPRLAAEPPECSRAPGRPCPVPPGQPGTAPLSPRQSTPTTIQTATGFSGGSTTDSRVAAA
jgi:NADPH:quinone reductase-like Zn-dependent oxidoreductase